MTSPIRSSPQQGVIFRDNVFRESDLMGLLLTQTSAALTNDALAQTIRDIQKQVGPSVPCTMETFYPVIVMQLQQPAVLDTTAVEGEHLQQFLLRPPREWLRLVERTWGEHRGAMIKALARG